MYIVASSHVDTSLDTFPLFSVGFIFPSFAAIVAVGDIDFVGDGLFFCVAIVPAVESSLSVPSSTGTFLFFFNRFLLLCPLSLFLVKISSLGGDLVYFTPSIVLFFCGAISAVTKRPLTLPDNIVMKLDSKKNSQNKA